MEVHEPLAADSGLFWGRMPKEARGIGGVSFPQSFAVLPKRLGKIPFCSREEDFIMAMERTYQQASQKELEVFLDEPDFLSEEDEIAFIK
jgi:hypothetical protein